MLAAMATATNRVRLGCQVTGMPDRHPSVLANIAATVDDEWRRKGEVLERHCADVGRDPSEIERSVNVRLMAGDDPRSLQPTIATWKDAGADVCIVSLGTPHDAAVMEPLAAALAEID